MLGPFGKRPLAFGGALLVVAVAAAVVVATSSGGPAGTASRTAPVVGGQMRVASASQVQAAGLDPAATAARKQVLIQVKGYISKPITVPEAQGGVVRLSCPNHFVAIAGGSVNNKINLTLNTSSNINPESGKAVKDKWYVGMTNANVDGIGGPRSFQGVVTCLGKFD